jgi:LuxR family maltose regulon positive regulatory protein
VNSNLLTTKLYPPAPRHNFVLRRHVLESLEEALNHKLILLAAPPGYGKTTLLSIWTDRTELPIAWLSLDSDDNDPSLFLQYLITSLQTINPEVGHASLSQLKTPQLPSGKDILPALINDLTKINHDFALILDDYHWIEEKEIHSTLNYLIDHFPEKMHLLIASRSDPPLHLSRLRARNQLIEVRQDDLRLTSSEAREFMSHSMEMNLSSHQIEMLEKRTEGWVAGLQLAAISLRNKEDIDEFIQTFSGSHRFVIDYLADEVVATQSSEVKEFLRKTSILDRLNASLCDEITGQKDSKEILRYLEENNLFLIPLDEKREWFRYHHLFLDYLRSDLESSEIPSLHIKASQWFMSNGLYSEAVKHAINSGDDEQAINAISQAAPIAIEQATFSSLLGWFNELPDQIVQDNGVLSLYKSFTLFFTQSYRQAIPYAQSAQDNFPPNSSSSLFGKLLCLQAHLALFQNDLKTVIKFSREALEYLSDEDTFFRNLTLNLLGQVLEMKSDVESAADVYRQGFDAGYQTGERMGTMVVFTNLVYSLNELGRLKEAIELCQRVDSEIGQETFAGETVANVINLSRSLLSFEINQLEIARKEAQMALEALTRSGISQGISLAQYILARIHLNNHEWDELSDLTRQGIQHAAQTGTAQTHGTWFSALEAQASLLRGDLADVTQWVESSGYTPQDAPHHWAEQPYFTYVRYLLAQDRLGDAQLLLNTMETSAVNGNRQRKLITIYLLMALIDEVQDNRSSALLRLERALSIAAPQGYLRACLDEGATILNLLPEIRHLAPEFVDKLLVKTPSNGSPSLRIEHSYVSLSEREVEVLRLVSRGYSNRQIAEALFVTLGTVKKHLNNIFGKLQVQNRTQAVARARELKLLY